MRPSPPVWEIASFTSAFTSSGVPSRRVFHWLEPLGAGAGRSQLPGDVLELQHRDAEDGLLAAGR